MVRNVSFIIGHQSLLASQRALGNLHMEIHLLVFPDVFKLFFHLLELLKIFFRSLICDVFVFKNVLVCL